MRCKVSRSRSGASAKCAALAWALLFHPAPAHAHGDLHEQIAALTQQIQRSPTNAELHIRRGELHRVHQEWDAAHADFDRALILDPGLKGVDFLRARLFLEAGWPLSAEALADQVLQRQPTHAEALVLRARARDKLGKGLLAAADFTAAIALTSQPGPELYIERARVLTDLGAEHWPAALAGLEEGVAKFGPLVTLQLYAVDLEVKQQRYDAALKRLEQLAAKSPRKETWLARRGEILVAAGRRREAREAFVAAQEALGRLPPARRQVPAMVELEKRLGEAIVALDKEP